MTGRFEALICALLFAPGTLFGTTNAGVHLFCFSLHFHPATTNSFTLELSTASQSAPANGELAPVFDPQAPNHGSGFTLHDPQLGDVPGLIFFDTPSFSDVNSNGFDDFFETSQGVSATTTQGYFHSAVDDGSVTATWSRVAGSTSGTCQLHLEAMTFGDLGTFTHTFDLLEYTGTLDYTPGSNTVTGTITLMQTGTPANTLTGTVAFAKVATNRFDQLVLQPGTWTNALAQSLSYTNSAIFRDRSLATNYFGTLFFADGDPSTTDPDYQLWEISIDDANDSNQNGVPDFSDDPAGTSASQPRLTLTSSAGVGLRLSIRGNVGQTYQVQQVSSLLQTNWAAVLSLTLSNNPQSVSLAAPTNGPTFWRALAP